MVNMMVVGDGNYSWYIMQSRWCTQCTSFQHWVKRTAAGWYINNHHHQFCHPIATSASTATHPHGCGDLDLPPACQSSRLLLEKVVAEGDTNLSDFHWKKMFLDWKTSVWDGFRWFFHMFQPSLDDITWTDVLIAGKWRYQRFVLKKSLFCCWIDGFSWNKTVRVGIPTFQRCGCWNW